MCIKDMLVPTSNLNNRRPLNIYPPLNNFLPFKATLQDNC